MKPIEKSCDIAVIGAGAAGIAAAVAAAENGAKKVILIEGYGFLGGQAVSAWVGTVCGLYYRHPSTAHFAVKGFARDFALQMQKQTGQTPVCYDQGLHFLPYSPPDFHTLAMQRLQQSRVEILLHSQLSSVSHQNGNIQSLSILSPCGLLQLSPDVVVDCSGNAFVSYLANIPRHSASHYQSGALVFQVSGLPTLETKILNLQLLRVLTRGLQDGALSRSALNLSMIPGTYQQGNALLKLGAQLPYTDCPEALSRYEIDMRELCADLLAYLRNDPTFKKLAVTAVAPQVGIRSAPRSRGIKRLQKNMVLNALKPEDGVAIGAWPIEYWGKAAKPQMDYFAVHDCYWIPAGCLVSPTLKNLFFAGRAMSATESAIASARVIGTCFSSGYAAGQLAAEMYLTGQWQSAIDKIRDYQIL